jgi:hypothetical protein
MSISEQVAPADAERSQNASVAHTIISLRQCLASGPQVLGCLEHSRYKVRLELLQYPGIS